MTGPTTFHQGPDVPDDEVLHDSRGRAVDDAYVDAAVEDSRARMRTRGRPSLSESGESPMLRVRVPRELDAAVGRAAAHAGTSRAEWVRRVLDEATRRSSA